MIHLHHPPNESLMPPSFRCFSHYSLCSSTSLHRPFTSRLSGGSSTVLDLRLPNRLPSLTSPIPQYGLAEFVLSLVSAAHHSFPLVPTKFIAKAGTLISLPAYTKLRYSLSLRDRMTAVVDQPRTGRASPCHQCPSLTSLLLLMRDTSVSTLDPPPAHLFFRCPTSSGQLLKIFTLSTAFSISVLLDLFSLQ